ncbi:hypothetical protein ACA910_005075 [Epithemia clementina (nom. ined.)]
MNDNQNYNVRDGRTTSKVLAPPGGRSTLTLGVDPAPVRPTQKAPEKKVSAQTQKLETKEAAATSMACPVSTLPVATQSNQKPVSSNAFAASSNMNGAQVMTGRPTSRVLHPGGGGGPTQWTLG